MNEFFPDGKVKAPSNPYLWFPYSADHFVPEYEDIAYDLFAIVDQPGDIVKYGRTYNLCYDADEAKNYEQPGDYFNEMYGISDSTYWLQVDLKIDGGDWHYTEGWDDDTEWPDEEELGYHNNIDAITSGSTLSGEFANAFFAKGGENDVTKHTYEIRTRYIVRYTPAGTDSNGDEYAPRFLLSDWSKTTSIGKNGTQQKLTRPKSIPAPQISFERKDFDKKGKWTGCFWFNVVYDKVVNDYEKYLMIEGEGGWEALVYYMEAAIDDLSESNYVDITEFACTSPLYSDIRLSGLEDNAKKYNSDTRILVREYIHTNEDNEVRSDYAYLVPQVSGIKAKTQDTKSITLT